MTAAVMLFVFCAEPQTEAVCANKPNVSARAAVLITADTGEIVYSVNCDAKLPMASTTKIMTTLLCLESGDLDEQFVVDSDAIKVEGSSMGLQEGDIVTKYDLCCGMLLPSGNDAANATAVKIAGSIEAFADMMNERAAQIGMTHTYFVTPSGLEGEGHGASAFDMAILAREALKNETFREICSSPSIGVCFGNPPYNRRLYNTNKLLTMYDGVYGVKTGFTDEAGRCLVSACERDGTELICVTLNDRSDWNDHIAMYNYGFGCVKKKQVDLPADLAIDIVGGECGSVRISAENPYIELSCVGEDVPTLEYTVISQPFLYAPVNSGEEVAQLSVCMGGKELMRLPLYADENCPIKAAEKRKKRNPIEKFFDMIVGLFK